MMNKKTDDNKEYGEKLSTAISWFNTLNVFERDSITSKHIFRFVCWIPGKFFDPLTQDELIKLYELENLTSQQQINNMKNLVYAYKINDSENTGIIDLSKNPPEVYCYCSKEVAEEILKNRKNIPTTENQTKIEWREQNTKFGLDYSTKTGKWEDYKFDIRYDYDGNPDEKPSKCILNLTIMKKGEIIERERSYNIEDLVSFSKIYMLDEQRKFLKGNFN